MSSKNHLVVTDAITDSFGVEFYIDDQLVLEIFRVDTERRKEVVFYCSRVDLEYLEECIRIFKSEIPNEFVS